MFHAKRLTTIMSSQILLLKVAHSFAMTRMQSFKTPIANLRACLILLPEMRLMLQEKTVSDLFQGFQQVL